MRPENDNVRIAHMREAAARAVKFSAGRSRADLDDDDMLVLALTKLVEIVGEAAKHVTPETRSRYAGVPSSDAARTRDRLIHHYFDIDLDVLWLTVTADLPELLRLWTRIRNASDLGHCNYSTALTRPKYPD